MDIPLFAAKSMALSSSHNTKLPRCDSKEHPHCNIQYGRLTITWLYQVKASDAGSWVAHYFTLTEILDSYRKQPDTQENGFAMLQLLVHIVPTKNNGSFTYENVWPDKSQNPAKHIGLTRALHKPNSGLIKRA